MAVALFEETVDSVLPMHYFQFAVQLSVIYTIGSNDNLDYTLDEGGKLYKLLKFGDYLNVDQLPG